MDSSSPGIKQASSVATLAPVNSIVHVGDYFLVCEGSCLSVYKDRTLDCVINRQVLRSQNVHGIRACFDGVAPSETRFILFGSRFLQRVELIAQGTEIVDVQATGSSICVGDWIWDLKVFDALEVVLVSHNRLIFLARDGTKRSVDCAIPCILYSGNIVAENPENVLVAAGTVFNEVLLWSGTTGEVWHRLKGHDGVIFSITISTEENLLISTSDDRSARIYKLEDGDFKKPETIAQAKFSEIAACYGHSSRVWRAAFWKSENFATVGEDGNLCIWRISDGSLLARKQMPFKSSIASICIHEDFAYLGGAYGCFAAVNISQLDVGVVGKRSIVTLPHLDENGVIKNVTIDRGKLVSSDSRGNYALHCMKAENIKWNARFVLDECQDYSVMGQIGGYLFTGCKLGIVVSFAITDSEFVVWDTQQIHSGQIFSVVPFIGHTADQLYVLTSGLSGSMCCTRFCQREKSLIKLKSFALPIAQQRWATCAVAHPKFLLVIVGDRQGNVLLYSLCKYQSSTNPLSTLAQLHGSNGTTDLQLVQDRILSCGRNGCMYQLDVQNRKLVVLRKIRMHSPMSWVAKFLPFGDKLLVAGFIADDFVVCEPETDYVLWSITARGSSHKPWDCGIHQDRLFFVTANRIDGGVSYEHIDIGKKLAKVAKFPLHKRKINCVHNLWTEPSGVTVIVTGGEDNLVILSEIRGNQIRPVVRLYEHISSIKAVDSVVICGDDRLMVTCGGRAQLNVWWVTSDLSVKLLDKHFVWNPDRNCKIKPWKSSAGRKLDPLTRYMSVNLKRLEDSEPPHFHITTACSDGGIRLFDYVLDGKLEILKLIVPNDFCQQQSFWLQGGSISDVLVNAATNGELTCYFASDTLEHRAGSKRVHQSGVNAVAFHDRFVATGGDDNALVVTEIRTASEHSHPEGSGDGSEPIREQRLLFEIKATVEKAHSAQITAIQWWTNDILMTVAIDQRVSWWSFDGGSSLCSLGESAMTCIADVSGATILSNNDILIVGQGAQIIRPDEALVRARLTFLEQTTAQPVRAGATE